MRTRLVFALAAIATSAGLALAQGPTDPPSQAQPASTSPEGLPGEPGYSVPPEFNPGAPAEENLLWIRAEYLLWWFKNSPLPVPLVTTTSRPDLQPLAAIGQDGTGVLLGDQDIDTGTRHGGRFTVGGWIDDHRLIGVEANYFFVAGHSVTQSIASTGGPDAPILAVPFFDADAGAESSFVLAAPGTAAGSATLSLFSQLQGAEVNGLVSLFSGGDLRFQVLGGFRFLDLHENLGFTTTSLGIQEPGPGSNNGLILDTSDQFDCRNRFYGFQVGARADYRLRDFFLDATVKVAMGDMHEIANLTGSASTNFFNAPQGGPFAGVPVQTIPGAGTFVQATNAGRSTRHQFDIVPEVNFKAGYQITTWARAFIGYDFLFLSNVLRPGNQIDRMINFSQTVQNAVAGNPSAPGVSPAVNLLGSEFWAQGINLGLELRY
jgi:hypothetical protein